MGTNSIGQIDLGSLYGVIAALSHPNPKDCFPWAWQNAIEITTALITTPHLAFAPVPRVKGLAKNILGDTLQLLSPIIPPTQSSDAEFQKLAREKTLGWLNRQSEKFLNYYNALSNNEGSYNRWLEWNIKYVWPEHCRRLGGLADKAFEQQVAKLTGIDIKDLSEIQALAATPEGLLEITHNSTDQYLELAIKIYILSILVRGVYYDYFARLSNAQYIHHQLREGILPQTVQSSLEFNVANTEYYLSTFLVASAFRPKKVEHRLKQWTTNILLARAAFFKENIDINPRSHDKTAIDAAINAIRHLGIDFKPNWIGPCIDVSFALGIGILTSFVLQDWQALLTTGTAYTLTRFPKKLSLMRKTLINPRKGLIDLVNAGPGRIKRTWLGSIKTTVNR